MTNSPQFFQEVRESLLEAIKDRRIGTLIDGEKGKVFVDTDDTLEKERMINIFLSKFEAHLLGLAEQMEAKKGEGALRLNTFKEGYKDGYNKGISTCQSLLPLKK